MRVRAETMNTLRGTINTLLAAVFLLSCTGAGPTASPGTAAAEPAGAGAAKPAPAPQAGRSTGEPGRSSRGPNPLKNVYFGEQHMHTQNSFDAFAVGVRNTWEDAYNWAKGKEFTLSTTGQKMKKSTPYDFVAITDHSEYFGVMKGMATERLYREIRPLRIYEGTTEIQKLIISRFLLK